MVVLDMHMQQAVVPEELPTSGYGAAQALTRLGFHPELIGGIAAMAVFREGR